MMLMSSFFIADAESMCNTILNKPLGLEYLNFAGQIFTSFQIC